jgi:transcriptional regulator with XRE-family HTH domain
MLEGGLEMEMQVDSQLIRAEREKRAWSQSHLATVTGLGLRTVQRIEVNGRGSYESAAAIAAAFSMSVADLMVNGAVAGKLSAVSSAAAGWVVAGVATAAALVLAALHWLPEGSAPADVAAEPVPTGLPEPRQVATAPDVNNLPGCSTLYDGPQSPNMYWQLECESRDPDWATETEDLLRSAAVGFLEQSPNHKGRFELTRVHCRSTICELRFLDDTPANGFTIDDRGVPGPELQLTTELKFGLLGVIYDAPWGTQFDPWRSTATGSTVGGVLEQRVYLQTKAADQRPL